MATTETHHLETALVILVMLAGVNAFAKNSPALSTGTRTQVASGQTAVSLLPAGGVDLERTKAIMESHPGQVDVVRQIVLTYAHAHGDFVQPCQFHSSADEETDPNLPRVTGSDP